MHHIQCLRQPHPVTLRLVPGISGRSKIAEMNLFRSPVAFQVRTQHHRGSKGQPGKTRSLYRRQRHIPVFTNNNRRLIDKAIPETAVASQDDRTAHDGLRLIPFHQTARKSSLTVIRSPFFHLRFTGKYAPAGHHPGVGHLRKPPQSCSMPGCARQW